MRFDGRTPSQIRSVKITPNVLRHAEGSVDISFGHTRVICSASVETQLPKWLQSSGQGWVSAEYGMLPRSTHTRIQRERAANSGRTQEISRLLGRSLRAAVDLKALGERQISIDCDVIQADGGTRTAAITGGFVALGLALQFLQAQSILPKIPLLHYVSAISVGLHQNQALLDLNYEEDAMCGVDMNFVMTDKSQLVEVQGTAESGTFSKDQMTHMMNLAETGCQALFVEQEKILGTFFPLNR
jgi:ribonuclease PH